MTQADRLRAIADDALTSTHANIMRHSANELDRMRASIESLRGLCKTAVGMLRDAGRDEDAETIAAHIGDMEP